MEPVVTYNPLKIGQNIDYVMVMNGDLNKNLDEYLKKHQLLVKNEQLYTKVVPDSLHKDSLLRHMYVKLDPYNKLITENQISYLLNIHNKARSNNRQVMLNLAGDIMSPEDYNKYLDELISNLETYKLSDRFYSIYFAKVNNTTFRTKKKRS